MPVVSFGDNLSFFVDRFEIYRKLKKKMRDNIEKVNLISFLQETESIDYSNPIITKQINLLKEKSTSNIDYIKNAYEFVGDEISHSWDVNANLVSKNASEVLINKTGICWTKSCLLAALLRGNRIPSGISY